MSYVRNDEVKFKNASNAKEAQESNTEYPLQDDDCLKCQL